MPLDPKTKKLIATLLDFYMAVDCECEGLKRILGDDINQSVKCIRCQIWEKLGNTHEAEFTKLNEILK